MSNMETPQYEYSEIDAEAKYSADEIKSKIEILEKLKDDDDQKWSDEYVSLADLLAVTTKYVLPRMVGRNGVNDQLLKEQLMAGYGVVAYATLIGMMERLKKTEWSERDIKEAREDIQEIRDELLPDLITIGMPNEAQKLNDIADQIDKKIAEIE